MTNTIVGQREVSKAENHKTKRILGEERSDLLEEWDWDNNSSTNPFEIAYGSHTKVWWKCKNGHSWQASPNHRTSKTRNCPYCAPNPKVLAGENDLATVYPNIALEWNYERNGGLLPVDVTSKSSKVVWWKCKLGHEWKTSVLHRADGSSCPKCATASQTSFPEQAVYYYVKKYYPDAINGYTDLFNNHGMELDIFVPSLKIGIEYDGIAFHRSAVQIKREYEKYQICEQNKIKLILIRENEKNANTDSSDVLLFVGKDLSNAIISLKEHFPLLNDIDVNRDSALIESTYRNAIKDRSFDSIYPCIASEWNYQKNGSLKPDMFSPRSSKSVWWKCKEGHEWQAKIDDRVRGTGCPYCSNNRILTGYNDLATKRPDLIKEWDYEKNKDLNPLMIAPGSGKKAWWRCKFNHSWEAEISSRNKGAGCPYCAGNKKG